MKDTLKKQITNMTATTLRAMPVLSFPDRPVFNTASAEPRMDRCRNPHFMVPLRREEVTAALAIAELSNNRHLYQSCKAVGDRPVNEKLYANTSIKTELDSVKRGDITSKSAYDVSSYVTIKKEPEESEEQPKYSPKRILETLPVHNTSLSYGNVMTSSSHQSRPTLVYSPTSLSDVSGEKWITREFFPYSPETFRLSNSCSPRKSPENENCVLYSRDQLNKGVLPSIVDSHNMSACGYDLSRLVPLMRQDQINARFGFQLPAKVFESARSTPEPSSWQQYSPYPDQVLSDQINHAGRRDIPSSYLKLKQQRKVAESRARIIRKLKLQRNFGSLKSLSDYYNKRIADRTTLQINAMDLSTSNRLISSLQLKIEAEDKSNVIEGRPNSRTSRPIDCHNNRVESSGLSAINDLVAIEMVARSRGAASRSTMGTNCNKRGQSSINPRGEELIKNHSNLEHLSSVVPPSSFIDTKFVGQSSTHNSQGDSYQKVQSPKPVRSPEMPDCHLPLKKRRLMDSNSGQAEEKREVEGHTTTEEQNKRVDSENHQATNKDIYEITADEDGDLPLHIAVVQGNMVAVERFLEKMEAHGVSVDTCNKQKQTAVHLAIIAEQPDIMATLLRHGASLTPRDRYGNTVLHLAVKSNSIICMVELLKGRKTNGIDVNAENIYGLTPLHLAVEYQRHEMLYHLLSSDALVNKRERKQGRTSLYLAAECNDLRAAKLLLDYQADPNLASYTGQTPRQVAAGRSHYDLLRLLELQSEAQ